MPLEVYSPHGYIELQNGTRVVTQQLDFRTEAQKFVQVTARGQLDLKLGNPFITSYKDTTMYERHNMAQTTEQRRDIIEKLYRAWELQPRQGFAQLLMNAILSSQKTINIVDFAHLEDADLASRVLAYAQHFNANMTSMVYTPYPGSTPTASSLKRTEKEPAQDKEQSLEDILRDFKL